MKSATKPDTGLPAARAAGRWWLNVRGKDGGVLLRSPDGREWRGSAAEVRKAALAPWDRRRLAGSLLLTRSRAAQGTAKRSRLVALVRCKAIQAAAYDEGIGLGGGTVPLPARLAVLAGAAARYMGETLVEFVAESVGAFVAATEHEAHKAGLAEIPLTRHERAAIERFDGGVR